MAEKDISPHDQLRMVGETVSTEIGNALLSQGRDLAYSAKIVLENKIPGVTSAQIDHADGSSDSATFVMRSNDFTIGDHIAGSSMVSLHDKDGHLIESTEGRSDFTIPGPNFHATYETTDMEGETQFVAEESCKLGDSKCPTIVRDASGKLLGSYKTSSDLSDNHLVETVKRAYSDANGQYLGTVNEVLTMSKDGQNGLMKMDISH